MRRLVWCALVRTFSYFSISARVDLFFAFCRTLVFPRQVYIISRVVYIHQIFFELVNERREVVDCEYRTLF